MKNGKKRSKENPGDFQVHSRARRERQGNCYLRGEQKLGEEYNKVLLQRLCPAHEKRHRTSGDR